MGVIAILLVVANANAQDNLKITRKGYDLVLINAAPELESKVVLIETFFTVYPVLGIQMTLGILFT